MKHLFKFIEFQEFYKLYSPFSVFGKEHKNAMHFYTQKSDIDFAHLETNKFIEFIKKYTNSSESKLAKIEYHLKNFSEFKTTFSNENLTTLDLFLIKKFLFNVTEIKNLLSDFNEISISNFSKNLENFYNDLCLNGGINETFYFASNFNKELGIIRGEIDTISLDIKKSKSDFILKIEKKYNIDFKNLDFIVIERDKIKNANNSEIFIENYDNDYVIVKPNYQILTEEEKLQKLISEEKKIEKDILEYFSKLFLLIKKEVAALVIELTNFDVYYSRARLALNLNLSMPEIDSQNIEVNIGHFTPLSQREKNYTPLNVSFNKNVNIIHGSNMGGKTILLKTVGLMQVLAQMGFFVPAKSFKTKIYKNIYFVGEISTSQDKSGLSSFGIEMAEFINAYEKSNETSMYLIDEFARTTNSKDASALISSILENLSEKVNTFTILSTHFDDLPRLNGFDFFRMKGLSKKAFDITENMDLYSRIEILHKFMIYEVEKEIEEVKSDAIRIAEILGLHKDIIIKARKYKLGGILDETSSSD